jgi:uncharacterized protein YjbI with pentapeptide repeats
MLKFTLDAIRVEVHYGGSSTKNRNYVDTWLLTGRGGNQMEIREHLTILKQGVVAWNQWRLQHPDIQPDLGGTSFRQVNLGGINLSETNLLGADFNCANLQGANLSRSILRGANFPATNLRGANLSRTNLWGAQFGNSSIGYADLSGADLSNTQLGGIDFSHVNLSDAKFYGAELGGTNLSNATLNGTDFTGAIMARTIFGDRDLRTVKGLETIQHRFSSPLSINTIYLSQGKIPEIFLRGTGVPDPLITYIRSTVGQHVEYHTCFISYSSKDENFAKRLYSDLQNSGVRCWFAPEDLKIGDHYHQRIDESIRAHEKLVLILSEQAVQSAWVEREVVAAREKEDRQQREVLFPIRLDDAVMHTTKAWAADVRRLWHIGDFTQWKDHDAYQMAFERLLRDLKAEHKPKG